MTEPGCELTGPVVAALLAEQFPEFAGLPVARFDAGADHVVFAAGPRWLFRFPLRADRVPPLEREVRVLAAVRGSLGASVPRVELLGAASARFPHPFVGYRRIPGVAADARTPAPGLASELGALLSTLHRTDPGAIPPPHQPPIEWSRLRAELTGVAGTIRPLLPAGLLAKAEPYLRGEVAEPAGDGPLRVIHHDLCPDHVLVDAGTGELTGLIDFSDALVGEVVLDFVGMIGLAGYPFLAGMAAHYDLPLGPGFDTTLRWLARTLTLTWLADTVAEGSPELPKHLRWVAYAFAD